MLKDSLKQLELPGDGSDCRAPSGLAPQHHLVAPLAAAPRHVRVEHSDNPSSSGSSSQQQQQKLQLVESPESQQTNMVPSLLHLGQTVAGAPTSHQAQQNPVPWDEQTEPSQTPGHCAPAAGAVAGAIGDLHGDPVMKSNYRGLTWDRKDGRWRVRIHFMGKQHHIGRFADEDEAARHFDSAAYYLFGDRAVTNFGVAAAASSDIPVSSSIKALLRTKISSGDGAKSAAAVPGGRWDLGAAAAAAGPATASQPVQPKIPHHSTQRQLHRQLQLPYTSNGIKPQRNVDGSESQQQQQYLQPMHLQHHSQYHDTVDTLTVIRNQSKTSSASSPQPEQQNQQQAIRYPELLLPSAPTPAAARPTPAWSLPLQMRSNHHHQQQQQRDGGEGLLDSPLGDKPHRLVTQLQQTPHSQNTNIELSRQDRFELHQQSISATVTGLQPHTISATVTGLQPHTISATVTGLQPHTTAESCGTALDLAALATAAAAEQAAQQWQQRQPHQRQQLAEPCLVPMVVDTAAAAAGQSEAVTAVLRQLFESSSPNITNRPTTDHTQTPRKDTMSELFQALLDLQQQHPAGPPTVAAGRTAAPAAVCHDLNGAPAARKASREGPGMASHAELVPQSTVTAAAAGKAGGERIMSGSMTNTHLVEDSLFSKLMQLHQQQQLCHCDSSSVTAADESQLTQLKRQKLKLLLEWQQHLQGHLQHYEQRQHQTLQLIAPGAGNKLLQLTSIHKGDSSSTGVAATTTVPVVAAVATNPVVGAEATGDVDRGESCALAAALECLVKPGTSSRGGNSKTLAGRKRNTTDDTQLPSTLSALAAAWAALQHSGGGCASTSSRDRSGRVQTPRGAASPSEADLVQHLVSNMQRSKTSHAAPHTGAAAAIAAANAAVAAAAAPEGVAAYGARSALQPAPSKETGFESGGGSSGPQAKRQRSLSSTDDIMAQLLAVVHLLGATQQEPAHRVE